MELVPKPEWSEEDETRFKSCIKILQPSDGYDTINTKWLKSIKNRVQPKQEWSEEDETCLEEVKQNFRINKDNMTPSLIEQYERFFTKIKSLRPQKQWKPSNEQMHYLFWIANVKLGDGVVEQEVSKHLNELYEDLLKLKS